MPELAVVDQAVRDRVAGDLTTTFLLEAAAGTGKTRVLVERYVACVLDPRHGTGDVRAVAAVTFTEKAAGELRHRIRQTLEVRVRSQTEGEAFRTAAQRALDDLDDAPIDTIHGFAGKLLREFPVPAGVDPAFEQLDALTGGMERTRMWDEWLAGLVDTSVDGASADAPPDASADATACRAPDEALVRGWLARLLEAGVKLDDVRALAIGAGGVFDERYDVDQVPAPPQEPDLLGALQGLAAPLQELRQFCQAACCDPSDRGYGAATDLAEGVERLLGDPPQNPDGLAARLFTLPVKRSGPGGRKGCWNEAAGGKDRLEALYRDLCTTVCGLRESYAAFITGLALAVADSFARWAAQTQIAAGKLDFADLLGRLRDLLVADLDARRALQDRFRYILVDEFQDTDPLQAEIVFLLAEQEPRAADWKSVRLEPGKLFVVGDPKQSIYRFRRADITLYDEVKDLIAAQPGGAGEILAIAQNFRTTPAAVEWANSVFTDVFGEDQAKGRQPGYERVTAFRPPTVGESAVSILLGRVYDSAALARRDEARAVAALLHEMTSGSERWRVQDRSSAGPRDGVGAEPTRVARWGDIAVLMRTTTGLPAYEHALREAGVPFRIEGGATYFERREVADALVCLRAIDDPSDGPAVYAALHSTLFGFSDDDLFLFVAAGGRLDVFADEQPGDCDPAGVPESLRLLRDLHVRRNACEPHQIVAELLLRTRAAELAASSGAAAAQALANLHKLVERARAFCGAGGGGLAAFLSWVKEAGESAGEQESQVDDAGDVVRLLTIHKAKGLEFPIVVVAAGAQDGGGGGREGAKPIVDRAGRRLAIKLKAALPGLAAQDLEPESYLALKEHEAVMQASELRRLLYVAATRARDHLVLSCFGALVRKDGERRKNIMLALLKDHIPLPQELACSEERTENDILVLAPSEPPAAAVQALGDGAVLAAEREGWIRARDELLARAQAPCAATSPSALEQVDTYGDGAAPAAAPAGRAGALALGSIVHACMERCRLDDESSVGPTAAAAAVDAGRPDLAAEAAALAAACWRSAPARAAAASPRVYRELPVGVEVEGVVVSGAVDLLYEDDGAWVVADFKTDRDADPETLRRRYLPQAAAYALAVEQATGGVVREVVLVAARDGGRDLSLPVDDALRARARDDIARAALAGAVLAADELGGDAAPAGAGLAGD